jgi:hypothetical protein
MTGDAIGAIEMTSTTPRAFLEIITLPPEYSCFGQQPAALGALKPNTGPYYGLAICPSS